MAEAEPFVSLRPQSPTNQPNSIPPSLIDTSDSNSLARLAAEACDDRKAVDILLIRVEEISFLADWFVICTGLSEVQVRAIGRSVEDRLGQNAGRFPLRREGQVEGRWLLIDYGDVIVHILTAKERTYYDLESFWAHGTQESFRPSSWVDADG